MICQAGAASAPAAPSRNVVASSAAGVSQCSETTAAKATPTATTPTCATIRRRRGSTTSASAPAGIVRRKSGAMVATCTADTISGFGLRLVISQLEAVSNIATPTAEIELAIRMTVKARWANTPQGEGGEAEGSGVETACEVTAPWPGSAALTSCAGSGSLATAHGTGIKGASDYCLLIISVD